MAWRNTARSMVAAATFIFALAGCGGGEEAINDPHYTIGGTISGLAGTMVLQNNGADDITLVADGAFSFPTKLGDGASFHVSILNQPVSPSQTCTVNNSSGTVAGANIANITVVCSTNAYTVSGSVTGLSGSGLVLQNNGAGDLTISANGNFTFATPVASGANYSVTVVGQPASPSQTCTVNSGSGSVSGSNIINVAVVCATNAYTVSGSVTGLTGSGLVLQNNGAGDQTISANGNFTFATPVASGANYSVTVVGQPSSPSQTCSVSNGNGSVTNADVTGVSVSCENLYSLGGTLNGLAPGASLTLQNNNGETLTLNSNGSFVFANLLNNATDYNVSILSQPADQTCSITYGAGTVNANNISNVNVSCGFLTRGGFIPTGSLTTARQYHTATLLPNGKVLVTGGWNGTTVLNSVEIYDPVTGSWSTAASLAVGRQYHTATLLPNGKVLVVGGSLGGAAWTGSAELYDPATNTWSLVAGATMPLYLHTATLLPNGKVLMAGGFVNNTTGLYDPATDTWTTVANITVGRYRHTATLLPNGKVLVAGGEISGGIRLASNELYDPATDTWSTAGTLATARSQHTATLLPNGKVLVAGGSAGTTAFATTEIYDPATGTWSAGSSLAIARYSHTATLLLDGKVLVAGGNIRSELYDPANDSWADADDLVYSYSGTATLLASGKVLLVGGISGYLPIRAVQLYDPAIGSWATAGNLATARAKHTATLLPNGKVLVAGGWVGVSALASAELYDPATDSWAPGASLAGTRYGHSTTLLPNGKVLVAGGWDGIAALASAELYNPATDTWSTAASLTDARHAHTATLLPNGKVLVTGGRQSGDTASTVAALSSAELYDPATDSWSSAGNLADARSAHTATLLPNGKVLVAGGSAASLVPYASPSLGSAELYEPNSNNWTATGSMNVARTEHTATLLPNGRVLIVGGSDGWSIDSTELYDPATGNWSNAASLAGRRTQHTATLLPNGKVLLAGGFNDSFCFSFGGGTCSTLAYTELYDAASNSWAIASNIAGDVTFHTATLLPDGRVLKTGGYASGPFLSTTELFW